MPEGMTPKTLLSDLPASTARPNEVTVVIETPKGSPNKYDYDDTIGAFRLATVVPEGMTFPYDFGFIPSTLGEDGDPLDILLFLDSPVVVGCVLTARLIGVIEARQRKKGGEWIRNDRLLGVASQAHTHAHVATLGDLRPHLLDEIEAFFGQYNTMHGKEFEPLARAGRKKARKLVDQGQAEFQRRRGAQQSVA